ncbi:bifunctional class I SAM-dependent methyltransferase/glycosyltransferase family 2 protein [Leptolyngbya sp. BC1307]|uniref:bifunctional class I SAM-dependent methyltransferase/glycosyltransferase family 2 protein n=1 Tax=Leptolyngbya sp. BC1307 TaxID=2029589 RepID=UPI001F0A3CDC|nr:bifunctional class I SAM-dependent methyltransferase/glycosyltransferase family 2 protein [Leptolyngbya sp. BC1307]
MIDTTIPLAHPRQTHKQAVLSHFNRCAPQLDGWRSRNRYYYQDLDRLHQFLIPAGSRVLEIGCGTGDLLQATYPGVGVGIDISPVAVNIARQKYPHLRFYCADTETLTPQKIGYLSDGPIEGPVDEPQTFDYIICANAASYFSDIQTAFSRLKPFCTPQTRLIITFHNYLWEPLLQLGEAVGLRRPQPPQNWLSMDDVANLLSITGYIPLKRGRRFLSPKRIPGLSRWINRYLAPLPGIKHLCLTNYVVARPDFRRAAITADAPSCSVVIPARNEAGNIESAIARLPQLGSRTEVIFVEGHSQDNTWQTIQKTLQSYSGPLILKAFQQTGQGKADAVRLGFAEATGDVLMILDADLTVPPEDLPHFFEAIATGQGEFINGSRLLYPRSRKAMPWLNTLANKTFALLFSFLLEQPLKDTLCGTKVLWRRDYQRLTAGRSYFGDFDPFGDFDLLFGAAKLNLHLVEVPIRYQPRSYGSSNIAHVKEGLVLLRMCAYASRKLKFI